MDAFLRRVRDDDGGFTLVELMVVVLIISILISIATPTYLGAQKKAQDRAAETLLRHGLTAAESYYADGNGFSNSTSALAALEPAISFVVHTNPNTAAAKNREVSVYTTAPTYILLITGSESDNLFMVVDYKTTAGSSSPGVYYKRSAWDHVGYTWQGWDDPVACGCGWKKNGW